MSDPSAIDRLVSAWNDPDPEGRAAHVAAALGDSFTYTDPRTDSPITSAEGFLRYLDMFHSMGPGAEVTRAAGPDAHHGHALARLNFGKDGKVFALGLYYFDTDTDGRITRVVGFMDTAA